MPLPAQRTFAALALALTTLSLAGTAAPAFAGLLATPITPDTIAKARVRGPDAINGLGDWFISNGTLCAAVSGSDHETGLSPWGGSLIDLGHCDADDDQWPFYHLLPNMNKAAPFKPVAIEAQQTDNSASILVTAQSLQWRVVTRYQLDLQHPSELQIVHRVQRVGEGESLTMLGALALHPHRSLAPYVLAPENPRLSSGYQLADFKHTDRLSQLEAMSAARLTVLVGDAGLDAPISYGMQLKDASLISRDGTRRPLPIFTLAHPNYSMQGVLTRPLWFDALQEANDKPGALSMLQSLLMDIADGETLELTQHIIVGRNVDAASVTDQVYQGASISGKLTRGPARIAIRDREGNAVTDIAPAADGSFRARLPLGLARVQLQIESLNSVTPPMTIALDRDAVNLGDITLKSADLRTWHGRPTGKLRIAPPSAPLRLIFTGLGDTPDPVLNSDLIPLYVADTRYNAPRHSNNLSLSGREAQPLEIDLPPGHYRIYASRGIEYSITQTNIRIDAAKPVQLRVNEPVRELNVDGWLSADFHVHAAPSFDSTMAPRARLISFVTQGADVMVASEHNVIVDYGPLLQELALQDELAIISGAELTGMARTDNVPYTNGHQNLFPLPHDPQAFAGGLMPHEGKRLRELIALRDERYPEALFQLNHPRDVNSLDPDNCYWENLLEGEHYDRLQPLQSVRNQSLIEKDPRSGRRDLDIDLLEVGNGADFGMYEIVREDWFSLLAQGERIFATANSDSHGARDVVALPLNYVPVADDSVNPLQRAEFLRSVREGRHFATSGPLLKVRLHSADLSAGMGETLHASDTELRVTARAASWVPLDSLRVYVNGQLHSTHPLENGRELRIPLIFASDSFVVVEAVAEATPLYRAVTGGHTPYAFSNPIFIEQP